MPEFAVGDFVRVEEENTRWWGHVGRIVSVRPEGSVLNFEYKVDLGPGPGVLGFNAGELELYG